MSTLMLTAKGKGWLLTSIKWFVPSVDEFEVDVPIRKLCKLLLQHIYLNKPCVALLVFKFVPVVARKLSEDFHSRLASEICQTGAVIGNRQIPCPSSVGPDTLSQEE